MSKLEKISFSTLSLLALIVTSIIVTCCMSIILYHTDNEKLLKEFQTKTERQVKQISVSLLFPLSVSDSITCNKIIEPILEDIDITKIEIYKQKSNFRLFTSVEKKTETKLNQNEVLIKQSEIKKDEKIIGLIIIYAYPNNKKELLKSLIIKSVIGIIILTLVQAIIYLIISKYFIKNTLNGIKRFISESYGKTDHAPHKKEFNLKELMSIKEVVNEMIYQYNAQYNELAVYLEKQKKLVKERTDELKTINNELRAANEETNATNEELYSKNIQLDNLNTELQKKQIEINNLLTELQKTNETLTITNIDLEKQRNELDEAMKKLTGAHVQLVQSEKMASLGILTAGIAHEINNPVNFITSSIYGLKNFFDSFKEIISFYEQITPENIEVQQKLIGEIREDLDFDFKIQSLSQIVGNINSGAERISKIVASLRSFSREDGEEMILTDVHESIDATLIMIQHEIKNRIEIIKEYSKVPKIPCYQGKINQVLLNILFNATQAIKEKGQIYVCTKFDETLNNVFISIKDTGVGIPDTVIDKIFEPFFTTKEVGKGTGLGLYISYNIIQQHKGQILVKTELGKGTEFIIELPA